MTQHRQEPLILGWREWAGLPHLGVAAIKAKIDTGARTSVLHAWNITVEDGGDGPSVRFELHPFPREAREDGVRVACRAPLADRRRVRNSGGVAELRCVIRTRLELGGAGWPIELCLANRDQMGFRMLIGRAALQGRAMVDPARSFLLGGQQDLLCRHARA